MDYEFFALLGIVVVLLGALITLLCRRRPMAQRRLAEQRRVAELEAFDRERRTRVWETHPAGGVQAIVLANQADPIATPPQSPQVRTATNVLAHQRPPASAAITQQPVSPTDGVFVEDPTHSPYGAETQRRHRHHHHHRHGDGDGGDRAGVPYGEELSDGSVPRSPAVVGAVVGPPRPHRLSHDGAPFVSHAGEDYGHASYITRSGAGGEGIVADESLKSSLSSA